MKHTPNFQLSPHGSIGVVFIFLLDFVKGPVLAAQEFFILGGKAVQNIFRRPHYGDDIILQMDTIGVGSLPIVVMTGFFSGAVMALQMSRALAQYGQVGRNGTIGLSYAGARTGAGADRDHGGRT